jgi:exodeoxyribonuclease V gamma subunit
MAVLRPLAVDADAHQVAALHSLRALVELRDHGMREPLPLFCATSAAWAAARHLGAGADDALRAAEECWKGSRGFAGEQDDPEHHRVWGAHPRLRDRLGEVPPEHERGGAWAGEPTRFGCLARRLWDDVLAAEVCGDVGHLAVGG